MKRSMILLCVVAVVGLAGSSSADAAILWGTSYLTPTYFSGAQVWTVDTGTGTVQMLKSYDPTVDMIDGHGITGFGDIAQAANSYLYVTVKTMGTGSFDLLAKLDPSNGSILGSWSIIDTAYSFGMDGSGVKATINSLQAVGNTLYGIEGGGVNNASLVQIALNAGGDFVSRTDYGNAGDMADGDLAIHPTTGVWYGTFWAGTGSTLDTIDPVTGNGTTGPNTGITSGGGSAAGLAFDETGTLWAGSWADRNLYTVSLSGGSTSGWSLSSQIGGNITGLSDVVPEPATIIIWSLLGLGSWLGLGVWRRRRGGPGLMKTQ